VIHTLRSWSSRRWTAAAVAFLPLVAVYLVEGPSWGVWWAVPGALLPAAFASLIVASYVPEPGSGRLVEVGCSPCAVVAGASILGSIILRDTSPSDAGTAVVALLLLGFGLAQRLVGAGTCSVPR
jgi:hypothetical protein